MEDIIDLTALEQISFGDKERMKKYIGIYLKNLPEFIAKLKTAFDAGDSEQLYTYVHTFKPQAKMMGIVKISGVIDALESDIKSGSNINELAPRIQMMISAFEESEEALNKVIAG